MSRGTPVLPARADRAAEGTPAVPHGPAQRGWLRRGWLRRGWARRVLQGLGDSCAFAGVALLGCLALVTVGALGSLFWAYVVER